MAKHIEDTIQENCFKWFDLQYSDLYFSLFTIPNGGKRGKMEALRFKRQGVRAGVSDIIFAYQGKTHYIEMKAPKGRQSDKQKAFQKHIERQGFDYYLCFSLEEFMKIINGIVKMK